MREREEGERDKGREEEREEGGREGGRECERREGESVRKGGRESEVEGERG